MKPDRGPVRETRIPAAAIPLEGTPGGFLVAPRVGTPIAKAPDNVPRRDFEIGVLTGPDFRCVARIDAGKRALRDNGYFAIDARLVLTCSRGNAPC